MAGPRNLVAAPRFVDRQFGLLSVVQPRYDEPDSHWRNGITFQNLCGMGGTTWDPYCVSGSAPAAKAGNVEITTFGARPFTVMAEVDCSAVGYTEDERRAMAIDALTRTEQYQVEQAFWTGTAGGDTNIVYPHLAASSSLLDPSSTILPISLQCAATEITGASTPLDVVEGIGRLEAAIAQCWPGQATLHVPTVLQETFQDHHLLKRDGAIQYMEATDNLVAFGAGYPGTSPAGVATANVAWVYATGPVMAYRSAPETFRFFEMFDRETNTLLSIVERTYVLAFPCCCLYAVPISTGGITTGQPQSAF